MYGELQVIEKTILDAISSEGEKSAINSVDFDRKEIVKVDDVWYTADLKAHSTGKLIPADLQTEELVYGDDTIENTNLRVVFGAEQGTCQGLFQQTRSILRPVQILQRVGYSMG